MMTVRNRSGTSKKQPRSTKYSDKLKVLILQKDAQLCLSKQAQPAGIPLSMYLAF